jgi:hypothetical protein
MATEHTPETESTSVVVLKGAEPSRLLDPLSAAALPHANALPWPVSQDALYVLYHSCAEHNRAIHLKAHGAFGGGFVGEDAGKVEGLCEKGSAVLFEDIGTDLETYGNAFLYRIRFGRKKEVIALEQRPARTMWRTKGGGYMQRQWDADGREIVTWYTADEIIHLRHPCPAAHWYSLPSWSGAAGMMQLVEAATRYNVAFFANNAVPDFGVFIIGAKLTPQQEDEFKQYLRREHAGPDNAHRLALLSFGDPNVKVEIKQFAQPKDGEFLKLLDAAKERIPIAHGTPPRMLGIVTAGALGGGSEVAGQFHTFEELTLKPLRSRMLGQLKPMWKELGVGYDPDPDKSRIGFKSIDLTPPDATPSPSDVAAAVTAGLLTVDEGRSLLNLAKSANPPNLANRAAVLLEILKSL